MAKTAATDAKIKKASSLILPMSSYPLNYLVDIAIRETAGKPMVCIHESLYIFAYGVGFAVFWMEKIGPLLYYLAMGKATRKLMELKVLYGVSGRREQAALKAHLLLAVFYQALFEVAVQDPDPITSKVICEGLEMALEVYRKALMRKENAAVALGSLQAFQEPVAAWRECIEKDEDDEHNEYNERIVRTLRNKFRRAAAMYSVPIRALDMLVTGLHLTDEDNAGSILDTTLIKVDPDGAISLKISSLEKEGAVATGQSPSQAAQIRLGMPSEASQCTWEALSVIWRNEPPATPPPANVKAFFEFCDKQPPSVFIDALRLWSKVTFPFAARLMMIPDALFLLKTIYTPDEFTRVVEVIDSYYLVEWANMFVHFLKMSKGEGLAVEDCEVKRLRAISLLSTQVMYGMDCVNPETLTKVQGIYKRTGLEAELDILELIYNEYPTMRGRVVNSNPDAKFQPPPSTH